MIRAAETGGAPSRREASTLLAAHARASGADEWHDDAMKARRIELASDDAGLDPRLRRHAVRPNSLPEGIAGDLMRGQGDGAPSPCALHVIGALQRERLRGL